MHKEHKSKPLSIDRKRNYTKERGIQKQELRWRLTINWSTLNPRGPMRVSSISAASRWVRYEIESRLSMVGPDTATLDPAASVDLIQNARIPGMRIGLRIPWNKNHRTLNLVNISLKRLWRSWVKDIDEVEKWLTENSFEGEGRKEGLWMLA